MPWNNASSDRAVARVLSYLAAARLAFFIQFVEIGRRDFQQVENDRDRDIRHDAEREDREVLERAAGEEIDPAEERAAGLLEQRREGLAVDAGSGHGDAEAEHREHRGREHEASAQFGDARGV